MHLIIIVYYKVYVLNVCTMCIINIYYNTILLLIYLFIYKCI